MKRKMRIRNIGTYAILILVGVIIVFPFIWMILTTFKTLPETQVLPVKILPEHWNFNNYIRVFETYPFATFFRNSVIVSVCTVVLQLLVISMAAYGFGCLDFPLKDAVFMVLLSTMMIPGQMYIIPRYQIIQKANLLNSLTALVLPALFSVSSTFLLRQHFMRIPRELAEAAMMDGASIYRIFFQIMLPQVKPGLATVAVLALIDSWNDLMWPLIVNDSPEKYTLAAGLRSLQNFDEVPHTPSILAGAFMSTFVLIVVYFIFQKKFIGAIEMSAGKE